MNGHDRGADQADGMLGDGPYHLLASLTANQAGFAGLISHSESLSESLDQFTEAVKPTRSRS